MSYKNDIVEWLTFGEEDTNKIHVLIVHGTKVATLFKTNTDHWTISYEDHNKMPEHVGHAGAHDLISMKRACETKFKKMIAQKPKAKDLKPTAGEAFVCVSNHDKTQHGLNRLVDWERALHGEGLSPTSITHDVDGRPMKVVHRFMARNWDDASDFFQKWNFG